MSVDVIEEFPRESGKSYGWPRQGINAQGNFVGVERQAALSQRSARFMGLGEPILANEYGRLTLAQKNYIIKYGTAGAKASFKMLATAPAKTKDAWRKAAYWYEQAVAIAMATSDPVEGPAGAGVELRLREAAAAAGTGNKWADEAKASGGGASQPVAQKQPEPKEEIVLPPVDIQVQTVKSAGFKWWMVLAAVAVGYVVFKPKKQEQQIDDLAGLG